MIDPSITGDIRMQGQLCVDINYLLNINTVNHYKAYHCSLSQETVNGSIIGLLSVYPRSSPSHKYSIVFTSLSVKEPWHGLDSLATETSESLDISLYINHEPVIFRATSAEDYSHWLAEFRGLAVAFIKQQAPSTPAKLKISAPIFTSSTDSNSKTIASIPLTPRRHETLVLNNYSSKRNSNASAIEMVTKLVQQMQILYGTTAEGQRLDAAEDEWLTMADTPAFVDLSLRTAQLQDITENELSMCDAAFYVNIYTLLSMHGSGVLRVSLQDMLSTYAENVAYVIGNKVFTLADIAALCEG